MRPSAPAGVNPEVTSPRIGVTSSQLRGPAYYLPYLRAVEAAGAVPVQIERQPGGPTPAEAAAILADLDGLVLPGGWDVDPLLYGEERGPDLGNLDPDLDQTELALTRAAVDRGLPVFGICRGEQLINVALGGTLHQHIAGHDFHGQPRNSPAHTIAVDQDSEFGRAVDVPTLTVNSLHHQAVKELAPGLRATAHSPDGWVEGVESNDGMVVAVQCHPEELVGEHSWARSLFNRFVARVRANRQARQGRSEIADAR